VRLIGRLVVALLSLVVLATAVYGGSRALDWAQSQDALGLLARDPVRPVRLTTLDAHTRAVAGKPWFGDYFTTMMFSRSGNGSYTSSSIVAKWEQPTVTVKLLNDGGPGIREYLRALLRRLDRLQQQVHFRIGDTHPLITVQFLEHDVYVRRNGTGSVGNTKTQYYAGSPGLIRATITVDVGVRTVPDDVKSTLIHELTHAIGASGHFVSPADRRRSVMYEANTLTNWSQNDASAIRLLYSPAIRSGMSPSDARSALQRYVPTRP
jgi:hypothetical protein